MAAKGRWAGRELPATGPVWEGDRVPVVGTQGPAPCAVTAPRDPQAAPQYPKGMLHLHRLLSCANKCCHTAQTQPEPLSFNPPSKDNKDTKRVQWYIQGTTKTCFLYFFKSPKNLNTARYTAMDKSKHLVKKIVVKIAARLSNLWIC